MLLLDANAHPGAQPEVLEELDDVGIRRARHGHHRLVTRLQRIERRGVGDLVGVQGRDGEAMGARRRTVEGHEQAVLHLLREIVLEGPGEAVRLVPGVAQHVGEEALDDAVAAIRRHRIVERFLADMLGYAWNEADRLAGTFEHDLPQEVEDRIFLALDRPATCPHGFPIPALEAVDIPAMPLLYALEPGDVATVAVPGSTDPEVVAFLDTMGLRPGVTVEVREKHPFDGPLVLRVAGRDRTLGATVANQVFVRRVPGRVGSQEGAESA